jgi:hypothetical protein
MSRSDPVFCETENGFINMALVRHIEVHHRERREDTWWRTWRLYFSRRHYVEISSYEKVAQYLEISPTDDTLLTKKLFTLAELQAKS